MKSLWVKKYMGEKYVQEESLGEKYMGEKYVQEEFLGESIWVKSMCKKSFWLKVYG